MNPGFNQDVHFNDMDNNTDRDQPIKIDNENILESNEEWCPVCGCNKNIMDSECSVCGC